MLHDLLRHASQTVVQQWTDAQTQWTWLGGSCFVLTIFVVWQVAKWWMIYANRPKNLYIGEAWPTQVFAKWLGSLKFVMAGADAIAETYRKIGGGAAFAIPSLSEYQVLVSSQQHIKELTQSPERVLSFHMAMEQRLRHKYTMFGFEHNDIDPHNSIPSRVLKVLLRMSLPKLQSRLQAPIQKVLSEELGRKEAVDGWKTVSAFGLVKRIISQVNNQILFGEELASNHEFQEATIRYNHDVVVTMEVCRHIPSLLVPIVATVMMGWSGAMKKVASFVTPLVEERLRQENNSKDSKQKPQDCIQWIIDSSHTPRQRTVSRLVQQAIAILFASAHQMPMGLVYAIYNLCIHPEYIAPLREEIEQASGKWNLGDQFEHMPLLDSFLRESARLNPLDALSIQRMALVPFTFSDGTHVPAGNLLAVPQQAFMRDGRHYTDPERFDGFRFVAFDEDGGSLRSRPKFTDVSWTYPYWGSVKKACPARWYVSRTLKQVLTILIRDYDLKLADEKAPRSFIWTTAIVPRFDTALMLRKRDQAQQDPS
ncbi:hypothetical protein VTN77DRAFT_981 [Rasamsonia byssochlamydoides]|uniref:uncharacterized protein n=1 Tax=Rasamsonia byssochlamydoides TaxID=89139 RepID=UPI0037426C9F